MYLMKNNAVQGFFLVWNLCETSLLFQNKNWIKQTLATFTFISMQLGVSCLNSDCRSNKKKIRIQPNTILICDIKYLMKNNAVQG
ncbi:hypothetical protein JTB14_026115 [Gonioctena quinquepunctata]|nr:hypothetical protein JTB14_026115 [Gonioctena quinquepunctata]